MMYYQVVNPLLAFGFSRSWAESGRRNEDCVQDAASPVPESEGYFFHTESSVPCTLLLGGSGDPNGPSVARKALPSRESRHARQTRKRGFRGQHVGYDLWKTQTANAFSARSGRAASCRKESENGEDASKVDASTSMKATY